MKTALVVAGLSLGAIALQDGQKATLEERVRSLEARVKALEKIHASGRAELAAPGESAVRATPAGAAHVGKAARAGSVEMLLASVRIDHIRFKDLFGGDKTSAKKYLIATFKVRNVSQRKILRYSSNQFLASACQMRDDAGNVIRSISGGLGQKISGELASGAEVYPGKSESHVEVFNVPPEATRYLNLSFDTSSFGSKGVVKFTITRKNLGWRDLK